MPDIIFVDDTGVRVDQFIVPGDGVDLSRDQFQVSAVDEGGRWHSLLLSRAQWYALCERIQSGVLP